VEQLILFAYGPFTANPNQRVTCVPEQGVGVTVTDCGGAPDRGEYPLPSTIDFRVEIVIRILGALHLIWSVLTLLAYSIVEAPVRARHRSVFVCLTAAVGHLLSQVAHNAESQHTLTQGSADATSPKEYGS
jgi:hypothetical protein